MTGRYKRSARVSDRIKREVGDLLIRGGLGKDFGFVTVTNVEMSDDLRNAKIYISIMGNEDEREEHFSELMKSKPKMRKILASRLQMRYVPTIKLYMDETLDNAINVQKILNKIDEEE